jgi:hypothetical protein
MAIKMESKNGTEKITVHNHEVMLETSFEGRVVAEYERNGYDDSDFMAVVYDEATCEFRHVMYATTRGWTYANSCVVDAPDCVMALYGAYLKGLEASAKRQAKAELVAGLEKGGLSEVAVAGWLEVYGIRNSSEVVARMRKLVSSKPRNGFRKSLKEQIVKWLETPIADRAYGSPLSIRQMQYV